MCSDFLLFPIKCTQLYDVSEFPKDKETKVLSNVTSLISIVRLSDE